MNSGRYGYINFCISGLRIIFFMYSKDASSSSSSGISVAFSNGLLLEDVLVSVSTVSSKNDFFGASSLSFLGLKKREKKKKKKKKKKIHRPTLTLALRLSLPLRHRIHSLRCRTSLG